MSDDMIRRKPRDGRARSIEQVERARAEFESAYRFGSFSTLWSREQGSQNCFTKLSILLLFSSHVSLRLLLFVGERISC